MSKTEVLESGRGGVLSAHGHAHHGSMENGFREEAEKYCHVPHQTLSVRSQDNSIEFLQEHGGRPKRNESSQAAAES